MKISELSVFAEICFVLKESFSFSQVNKNGERVAIFKVKWK